MLTAREQNRLLVLNALQRAECTINEAARVLGLSRRQVQRLRAAYRARGAKALVHGNRGRASPRRIPLGVRKRIATLARTTYAGVNRQHFTELLAEREGLRLSRPTIHRILSAAGIPAARRRRLPRHRQRRERLPHPGMLLQLDGSHHDWLQGRGPRLVLHAAVDDATGAVVGAIFRPQEDATGYLFVLRHVARTRGIPLAVYTDRHGIFRRDPMRALTVAEQLRGEPELTQVGRVLRELGIQWIPASSPQAKGRVERLFGAFQDRLTTELRLAGVHTIEHANHFLPLFLARYNARFARSPAQSDAMYRPWPPTAHLNEIFCFKYLRMVANDNTVALGPHRMQIFPHAQRASFAKTNVEIHERLDGTLVIFYRGHRLAIKRLTSPAPAAVAARPGRRLPKAVPDLVIPSKKRRRQSASQRTQPWRPPADHPWRRFVIGTKSLNT